MLCTVYYYLLSTPPVFLRIIIMYQYYYYCVNPLFIMNKSYIHPPAIHPSACHPSTCHSSIHPSTCHSSIHSSAIHPSPPTLPQVSILRSTTISLSPTTEMDVSLQFRGFIHPLWGAPPPAPPTTDTVSMWARIQRLHFEARMAPGPASNQLVRGGHTQEYQEY